MTRRGSRTEGRQPDQDRPPADYATGPPPRDAPWLPCACGAGYSDRPDGHAAHKAVFGHRPIRKPETRPGEAEARASGAASADQPTAEGDA